MNLLETKLEDYIGTYTSAESELLKKLNRSTWENLNTPRMLSGHVQGRFLSLISKLQSPKTILEIGTYSGYSSLCLAEGLDKEGVLHTIDCNEELKDFTTSFIKQSEFKDQIKMHIGNAMEIIPSLDINIDLVFIDADKQNYSEYYDLIFKKLNKNGIIIADNVLWSGKVVDKTLNDDETMALRKYVEKINNDDRVENILIGIRDGLMICRKISS